MKRITAESISPATKAWFGDQIQSMAMRHDMTGPNIEQVSVGDYQERLVTAFRSRARGAVDSKALTITADELDAYCTIAAEELIRTRRIHAAHKRGELPTEVLRKLPAYAAFPDYFEEAPGLVWDEAIAVVKDLFNSDEPDEDAAPLGQPGHPKHPVSRATREWMEFQAQGLACADDAWGAPFGSIPQEDYITECALRIRRNAHRAIRMGELHLPPEDVDNICWVAAGEAYLLRSLKAARDEGELSYEQIALMPIYGPYSEYFKNGAALIVMAKRVAGGAGIQLGPPGAKN